MPKIDTKNTDESLFKIIWRDLSYEIDLNKDKLFSLKSKKRKLLANLNGEFTSSSLIGILGPSGCGKSTLIKCLSRRQKKGVSGEINLIGHESVRVSFIPQHEEYSPIRMLTTKETLIFASRLQRNDDSTELTSVLSTNANDNQNKGKIKKSAKIKKSKSSSEFHSRIADLMLKELHLTHVSHNHVGKLSGGQQKRLSLGQCLIGNPDIVYLDECTSGLDSFSTLICITLLKHYSKLTFDYEHDLIDSNLFKKKSNLLVCTIHQPSEQVLNLFDEVLFLAERARFIYKDSPSNLIPVIQKNGGNCPEHYNPSEYLLEIISGLHGNELKNNLLNNLPMNYLNRNHRSIDELIAKHSKTSFLNEINVLFKRNLTILFRDKLELFGRLFYFLGLAIFIGLLFSTEASKHSACPQLSYIIAYLTNNNFYKNFEDQNYTQTELIALKNKYTIDENYDIIMTQMLAQNLSNFGFSIMVCLIGSTLPFSIYMPREMMITIKEHSNSLYSINSYFISKYFSDLPFTLFLSILFASLTYLINQQVMDLFRFCNFIAIFGIISMIGQIHGMIVGVVFYKNINYTIFLGPITLIPFLLFCGIFIRIEILPKLFQYLTYFSHLKYSFEAILLAIYSYDRCESTSFEDLVYLKSLVRNLERKLYLMVENVPKSFINKDDDFFQNKTRAQSFINVNGELFDLSKYSNNYSVDTSKEESLLFQTIPIDNKSITHKYIILLIHYLIHILILYFVLKWKLKK